jgi:hypothetical protein
MNRIDVGEGRAILEFSLEELFILNNALNEVCNGMRVPEFATRMGAELDEVDDLLDQIHSIIDQMMGSRA